MLFTIPNNGDIKKFFRSERLKPKAEKSACLATYINTYPGKGLSSMHRSIRRQGNDVSLMHVPIPYRCRAKAYAHQTPRCGANTCESARIPYAYKNE